mmetsp:Transcript_7821/g.16244  ORF Transcript_7821/g.16244 Transcript_7821/m.16244 type:complete len:221 (-) Transcript_7821:371-1033(-)
MFRVWQDDRWPVVGRRAAEALRGRRQASWLAAASHLLHQGLQRLQGYNAQSGQLLHCLFQERIFTSMLHGRPWPVWTHGLYAGRADSPVLPHQQLALAQQHRRRPGGGVRARTEGGCRVGAPAGLGRAGERIYGRGRPVEGVHCVDRQCRRLQVRDRLRVQPQDGVRDGRPQAHEPAGAGAHRGERGRGPIADLPGRLGEPPHLRQGPGLPGPLHDADSG